MLEQQHAAYQNLNLPQQDESPENYKSQHTWAFQENKVVKGCIECVIRCRWPRESVIVSQPGRKEVINSPLRTTMCTDSIADEASMKTMPTLRHGDIVIPIKAGIEPRNLQIVAADPFSQIFQ